MKASAMATSLLNVKLIRKQGISHPFGDHRSVNQAFPAGIPSKLSDPFLMWNYFGMQESSNPSTDPDDFPIGWHPHRGFDISSYIKSGIGRHGDSLGNREIFSTPGMQWMSTGSGVEHAEGGATQKGDFVQGFQIWINVPADRKMDDPRYGTVSCEDMPVVKLNDKATARVLAGSILGAEGPFKTVQPVEMVDFELEAGTTVELDIGKEMDTVILYIYEGGLEDLNEEGAVETGNVVLMDADSVEKRGLQMTTTLSSKAGIMLFSGKKLKEPIAWHGPIVMNTQQQIRDTFDELRSGLFSPKRVPWDYKKLNTFPESKQIEL